MKLSDSDIKIERTVTAIEDESFAFRLFELGIVPGVKLAIIQKAPFGGPIYIAVEDNLVALRKNEAEIITVED